jgi:hypothetical protein
MTKLSPRCFPANVEKEKRVRGIAYASNGFMLPCCWLDSKAYQKELEKFGLYDEELKVANNQNIESIINSKQWKDFIEMLRSNPELAPTKCKEKCGG